MRRIERENRGEFRPGQELIAAGYAGLEGSSRIALLRSGELSQWFSKAFIAEQQQAYSAAAPGACDWKKLGVSEWEEAGEGGVYTALWTLSGAHGLGFSVDLRRIPVKQGTIEICERYGLNPYRLLSGGCTVLAADHGFLLTERLRQQGIQARVIGYVRPDIVREVVYGEIRGFMERPREDEFYKIAGPYDRKQEE